jgi:hypothetical protein
MNITGKKASKDAFFISGSTHQTFASVAPRPHSDNVRLSIAAGMLGPHLHGRLL